MIYSPVQKTLQTRSFKVNISKEDKQSVELDAHFKLEASNPGDKQAYKFVPIHKQTFYCKDSRGEEANFGAPGGDFGEFLLALNEFKQLNKETCTVDALFEEWLKEKCSETRPFYAHTDQAALKRVFDHLQWPEVDIFTLSKDKQTAFLDALRNGEANFNGCGHLRLIRERQSEYEIDLSVMDAVFKSFFLRLWAGDRRVLLKVYDCDLDARALAVIYGPDDLDVSLLGRQKLTENGEQCFILNRHAVRQYRRLHLAPFFAKKLKMNPEDFFQKIEEKGWQNAGRTADALASGKPVFRIDLKEATK